MMFPFTWPFSRNIPESCSVPSSDTPWSKKPVHSSLALTLPAPLLPPDHFHAMASPDAGRDEPPIYSRAPFSQSAPPHLVPNRKSPRLTLSRPAVILRPRPHRSCATEFSSLLVILSAAKNQRPGRSSLRTAIVPHRKSRRPTVALSSRAER